MINIVRSSFSRISVRHCLLVLAVIVLPNLTGCRSVKSEGAAVLLDETGKPHSFAQATATLFALEPAVVTPGQTATPIGVGTVEEDGTRVTVKARRSRVHNEQHYLVKIQCPAGVPDDACDVETPLHIVLSGARFKAGGWQATALTEVAFQATTYAVAVDYAAEQVQQVLDDAAAALLTDPAPATTVSYADLLAWNPADAASLQRPAQVADFTAALVAGSSHNAVQAQAQQLINVLVGELDLNNRVQDIALAGNRAYLAGYNYDEAGALYVADITDPSRPVLTATLNDLGMADAVQVAGDYAYVVDGGDYWASNTAALRIISLANPDQPTPVTSFAIAGRPTDVAIAGNYAFITQRRVYTGDPGFAGLQIVDISNPAAPVNVGSLSITSGLVHLAVDGNRVYATGDGGLFAIDVSNPAAPTLAGSQLTVGSLNAIAVTGQYAYTEMYGVLYVIDTSDPALPVAATLTGVSGPDINVVGDRLYVGIYVIDISSPIAPQSAGLIPTGDSVQVLAPNGLLYAAASQSLAIYDARTVDRLPLMEGRFEVNQDFIYGLPGNTVAANGFAYASEITSGIYVFDLGDPLAPQYVGADNLRIYATQILLDGPVAYTGEVDGGSLGVLDISNPAALDGEFPMLGSLPITDNELFSPHALVLNDQHLYMAYGESLEDPETGEAITRGGLYAIDIQTPSDPQIAGHYESPTPIDSLAIAGDHAYQIADNDKLEVIDISNPQSPVLLTTLPLPGLVYFLATSGDVLYVAAGSNGVYTISIANPVTPVLLATLDTPGIAKRLAVENDVLYVADDSSGVQIVNVSVPAAPVLIGAARTIGTTEGVFLYDDYLYASTRYGFEIFRKPGTVSEEN